MCAKASRQNVSPQLPGTPACPSRAPRRGGVARGDPTRRTRSLYTGPEASLLWSVADGCGFRSFRLPSVVLAFQLSLAQFLAELLRAAKPERADMLTS